MWLRHVLYRQESRTLTSLITNQFIPADRLTDVSATRSCTTSKPGSAKDRARPYSVA
jgi:hypothetical protein